MKYQDLTLHNKKMFDLFLTYNSMYPNLHFILTGSLALILQDVIPQREVQDLDIIIPYDK